VGLQAQLWRGIAAFRFVSLAYAAVLLVVGRADYARPLLAWAVLAGMTGWTVFTTYAYAVPAPAQPRAADRRCAGDRGRTAVHAGRAATRAMWSWTWGLPDASGVEVTQGILQARPAARVLILSASGEQQDVLDAVKAGAAGWGAA
jgi:hypothetical protein